MRDLSGSGLDCEACGWFDGQMGGWRVSIPDITACHRWKVMCSEHVLWGFQWVHCLETYLYLYSLSS